jgi:hypothetical protein
MPSSIAAAVYRGFRREDGTAEIAVEDEHGSTTGTVRHLPKHSPTGMNWGYAGSGPADTARSLLIDALGDDAVCRVCAGTGRVVYVRDESGQALTPEPFDPCRHPWASHGWVCECDEGYRQLPYPRFAAQFVTRWPVQWTMTRAGILEWIRSHEQSGPESDTALPRRATAPPSHDPEPRPPTHGHPRQPSSGSLPSECPGSLAPARRSLPPVAFASG